MRLSFWAFTKLLSEHDKRLYCVLARRFQRPRYQSILKSLSASADGPVYGLTAFILLFAHEQGKSFFLLLASTFAIELPLYWLLKNSIRRTRPCHQSLGIKTAFEPSDRFSLPSGHTAGACVFALVVQAIYPAFAALAFVWVALVGISRIGLGVHYPLDIVAGILLGWVAFGMVPVTLLAL